MQKDITSFFKQVSEQKTEKKVAILIDKEEKELYQYVADLQQKEFNKDDLIQCRDLIKSKEFKDILKAVIIARKMLSTSTQYFRDFEEIGLIPEFISILKDTKPNAHVLYEILMALGSLCENVHNAELCINNGIMKATFQYFYHKNQDIRNQAFLLCKSLASTTFKYLLITNDIAQQIVEITKIMIDSKKVPIPKEIIACASELCRVKLLPEFKQVSTLIPIFIYVLKTSTPDEYASLTDSLWALSYLTENDLDLIIEANIVDELVGYLKDPLVNLQVPALRILGNLVSGSEKQIKILLDNPDFLTNIFQSLDNANKDICRESLGLLSKILAVKDGTSVDKIISDDKVVKKIISIAKNDEKEVSKEAFQIISNATNSAIPAQMFKLLDNDILELFISNLVNQADDQIIISSLEGIRSILTVGKGMQFDTENKYENQYLKVLDGLGGMAAIEKLQFHPNHAIYDKSLTLIEDFFEYEE